MNLNTPFYKLTYLSFPHNKFPISPPPYYASLPRRTIPSCKLAYFHETLCSFLQNASPINFGVSISQKSSIVSFGQSNPPHSLSPHTHLDYLLLILRRSPHPIPRIQLPIPPKRTLIPLNGLLNTLLHRHIALVPQQSMRLADIGIRKRHTPHLRRHLLNIHFFPHVLFHQGDKVIQLRPRPFDQIENLIRVRPINGLKTPLTISST